MRQTGHNRVLPCIPPASRKWKPLKEMQPVRKVISWCAVLAEKQIDATNSSDSPFSHQTRWVPTQKIASCTVGCSGWNHLGRHNNAHISISLYFFNTTVRQCSVRAWNAIYVGY